MNPVAILQGRRDIIGWLANMQDGDLYELVKRMVTKNFIKNSVTFKGVFKLVFFVLYRKILQMICHYE